MSNSQSAHDVSVCDDDDGYGEIGVYARRTGTVIRQLLTFCVKVVFLSVHVVCCLCACVLYTHPDAVQYSVFL